MSTVTVSGAQGQTINLQFDSAVNASIARTLAGYISAKVADGGMVASSSASGPPSQPSPGHPGEWVQADDGVTVLPSGMQAVVNTSRSAVIFGSGDLDESIISGSGNMTFFATGGSGTVVAAGGNNRIVVPGTDDGAWSVSTGDGNDVILAMGGGHDSIAAGGGNNTILLGSGSNFVHSTGHDHIQTSAGSATIVADHGARDEIAGGSGQLLFVGGDGDATIGAGTGSVTVFGASGRGEFHGGSAGHNLLIAGTGAATLFGAGNGDQLYANGDKGQVLHAGAGAETLFGGLSGGKNTFYQGCSTLRDSQHFEQFLDTDETGPVAVLAERVGLVGLEDVEGEAAQAGEHARIGADARAVFAQGDVAAVVRGILDLPVRADGLGSASGGDRSV